MIAAAAPADTGTRVIEVLVVRFREGNTPYRMGLLVSQVAGLLRRQAATVRPAERPGPGRAFAEALYEDAWLPVYDLAGALGLLAPWKMGRVTAPRPYLLVIRPRPGQQVMVSVDEVAEIATCRLDRVHPLPGWLRRQLHPALVWAGVQGTDLGSTQGEDAPIRPADEAAGLLLLLDCGPLVADSGIVMG